MSVDVALQQMYGEIVALKRDLERLRTLELPRGILHREVIVGTTTASVTISPIPALPGDLVISVSGRTLKAATSEAVFLRINGDAGGNYEQQQFQSNGAGTFSADAYAQVYATVGFLPGTTATTTATGGARVWLPDYASAVPYKHVLSEWDLKTGVTTPTLYAGKFTSFWRSNAAITSVTIGMASDYFLAGTVITVSIGL